MPPLQVPQLVRLLTSVATALNQHDPSRLHQLFFVDPPVAMRWPLQAARPLVHADVRKRLCICSVHDPLLPTDLTLIPDAWCTWSKTARYCTICPIFVRYTGVIIHRVTHMTCSKYWTMKTLAEPCMILYSLALAPVCHALHSRSLVQVHVDLLMSCCYSPCPLSICRLHLL